MPLYLFEYYDDNGDRHEFKDFYSSDTNFDNIQSPCGNFKAQKIISDQFSMQSGMTASEKKQGTTKQRSEYSKFMRNQKDIRKSTYNPGSREFNSNEIWTGKEGLDGVTQLPIDKKVVRKKN